MTKDQATSLREKLLALRTRLLDHAAQEVDVNSYALGWLRMVADVQLALHALEEATGRPTP